MLAILVEPYIFRIYAILTANLNKLGDPERCHNRRSDHRSGDIEEYLGIALYELETINAVLV